MKFNILLALATSGILSACGGGGGGSTGTTPPGDTTAPVVASVNQTLTAGSTVTLTATATDNIAVTGYCFKTESTTPLAADACFQATGQKAGLSLAKNLTHYVWAKDAAGNVSAASTGSCSAAGFTASNATSKNVVCMLTDKGQVVLELDATKAPITVANFLSYTNAGFYGNTTFHRVISTFMVQGGGFTYANGAYSQKATNAAIVLEKTSTTGLSNLRGTIAMARTSVPNSATSQFFINVVDNLFLNANVNPSDLNGYAVFGKVIAGMDVVDVIKGVTTGTVSGMADAPATPVYVQWAYQVQ